VAPAVTANHQDPVAWEIVFLLLFFCFLCSHLLVVSATAKACNLVYYYSLRRNIQQKEKKKSHFEIDLDCSFFVQPIPSPL